MAFLLYSLSFLIFLFFIILPILEGAPFLPIPKEKIERAIQLIDLKPGQKFVDLGAGEGRILILAAKKGAQAFGFEINPFLVLLANLNIKREKVQNLAVCQWKNFWRQDLSSFDVVFIYGIGQIMNRLEKKLKKELKAGAKVVSFIFQLPNQQPEIKENGIYIYQF